MSCVCFINGDEDSFRTTSSTIGSEKKVATTVVNLFFLEIAIPFPKTNCTGLAMVKYES